MTTSRRTRALATFVKLQRAARTLLARVDGPLTDHGLSPSEFGVLEALWHLGPLTAGELAGKLLCSGGNITLVVDRLIDAGWVDRRRCPEDRRRVAVSLTSAGAAFIEPVFARHAERIEQAFALLTDTEIDHLGDLLQTIGLGERRRAAR